MPFSVQVLGSGQYTGQEEVLVLYLWELPVCLGEGELSVLGIFLQASIYERLRGTSTMQAAFPLSSLSHLILSAKW